MGIDPVDGCTFWYTQEYYLTSDTDWRTRIGAFRLPACSGTTASVTLGLSRSVVPFGDRVTLSGRASTGRANQTVTIFARRFDETGFAQVANVPTGPDGSWSVEVQPAARTIYLSGFEEVESTESSVDVRPRIQFLPSGRRFSVHVSAARSFAGHYVQLQRRAGPATWIGVSRYRLGRGSSRIFPVLRRHRTSVYRMFLTAKEAGQGYIESWSGTQRVSGG